MGERAMDIKLFELAARYRKGIFIALSLVVLEQLAWIIEPAVFGKVIDALIDTRFLQRTARGSVSRLGH